MTMSTRVRPYTSKEAGAQEYFLKAVKVFRKRPTSLSPLGPLLSQRVKEEPKLLQVIRRLQDHHPRFLL